MKVTLSDIVNSVTGLRKLVNEPVPAKTAYRIKRIMDVVTAETGRIEKLRSELIQKYADEQTEEDKAKKLPVRVTTKGKEFQEEFTGLLAEEIEVNVVKLPFASIENAKLTVGELSSLEVWFDMPEEKVEEKKA